MQQIKLFLPLISSFFFLAGCPNDDKKEVSEASEQQEQKPQEVKVAEGIAQFMQKLGKQESTVMKDANVKTALSGLLGYLLTLKNDKGASHIAVAKPLIESFTAFLQNQDQELLTSADIQAAVQAHLKEVKTIAPKAQNPNVPPAGSPAQPFVIPGARNPGIKQEALQAPQTTVQKPASTAFAQNVNKSGVVQNLVQPNGTKSQTPNASVVNKPTVPQASQTTVQKSAPTPLAQQMSNSTFGQGLIQPNGTTSTTSNASVVKTTKIPQAPDLNTKPTPPRAQNLSSTIASTTTSTQRNNNSTGTKVNGFSATSRLKNNMAQNQTGIMNNVSNPQSSTTRAK